MREVYTSNRKRLILGKKIGEGGEGEVYKIKGWKWEIAKIYRKPSKEHEQKVEIMIQAPPEEPLFDKIGHRIFAWPTELLRNRDGEFVGYIMPYIRDSVSLFRILHPEERKESEFRHINRIQLYQLAFNLAFAVYIAHKNGYIIGDLNESNVLINKKGRVSIIDTDSFQVSRNGLFYPCPVGKEEYLAPELLKDHSQRKREVWHDAYALSVLVFRLLMEGHFPYSGKRRENLTWGEVLRSPVFPYESSQAIGKVEPPPNMEQIWKTLPEPVRELFKRCFIDGLQNPKQRPTPPEWCFVLDAVDSLLQRQLGDSYKRTILGRIPCPSCGLKNRSNKLLCESCGTPLYGIQQCPYCSRWIPQKARYCILCGKKL